MAALRLDPGNGALWRELGHARLAAGQADDAAAAYARATVEDPWCADAHRDLGHARACVGDRAGAQAAWLAAVALGGGDAAAFEALAPLGQELEARLVAQGWGLRADAAPPRTARLAGWLAAARARRLARRGRWREAGIAYAAQALSASAPAAVQRGHACSQSGDEQEAERAYWRAATLAPGWAEPLVHLGFLMKRTGQPREAMMFFALAETFSPGSPRARQGLSELGLRPAEVARVAWTTWMAAGRRGADPDAPVSVHDLGASPPEGMTPEAAAIYADLLAALVG